MDAVKSKSNPLNLWQLFIKSFQKRETLFSVFLCFGTSLSFAQTNLVGKWADAAHKEKQVEMYLGSNQKGQLVFKDFVYDTKTETYKGILINPDEGQVFTISIKQPSSSKFNFAVKKFIFSKTFVFERRGGH